MRPVYTASAYYNARLSIAIIGRGISNYTSIDLGNTILLTAADGLAATSLRRAGHKVTIYERTDYAGEFRASASGAANGTRWLQEWNVDVRIGRPVVLRTLILRDCGTGDVLDVYNLGDYEKRWGCGCISDYPAWSNTELMTPVSIVFHMENMQEMLLDPATGAGAGEPAVLKLNHACETIDHETRRITLRNQTSAQHNLIVGADGVEYAISPPPMS